MEYKDNLKIELTKMLGWFHNYCVENNLRYYMLGGTMLGAARHKGFIPWDDDIDVGMPRTDFEKLEKNIGNKFVGRYFFETPNTSAKDFSYTYGKLYDTNTTLIEHRRVSVKRGIYIDIFPLDGVANSEAEIKQYFKKINNKRLLYLARVAGIRRGRSTIKNASVILARLIPSFVLNNKKLLLEINDECSQRSFDDYAYVGNLNGAWGIKEIMPREYFGTPRLYEFENIRAYGVENYDGYLSHQYGDWRKLPPIEKQVTNHDNLIIDLQHSYLD